MTSCELLPSGSDLDGPLEGRRDRPCEMLRESAGGGGPPQAKPSPQGRIWLQLALTVWQLRGIINIAAHKWATCIYYVSRSLEITSNGQLVECWAPRRMQYKRACLLGRASDQGEEGRGRDDVSWRADGGRGPGPSSRAANRVDRGLGSLTKDHTPAQPGSAGGLEQVRVPRASEFPRL